MTSDARLSVHDIALLRRVFAWARAEGWRRARKFPHAHQWKSATHRVWLEHNSEPAYLDAERRVDEGPPVGVRWKDLGSLHTNSVRDAVDILAALGILPVEMSTAYQAGRESVLAPELNDIEATGRCAMTSARLSTADIPAEVLVQTRLAVQLHFHDGEPWPGHNVDAARCQICNDAADIAARLAYRAGHADGYGQGRDDEAAGVELNDIEATGSCCCNGCIGEGLCDLAEPEERAKAWQWTDDARGRE